MDTSPPRRPGAILLIILWNCLTTQTNLAGVAWPHHRPDGAPVFRSGYCTEGMILAAGTSWPSRLGGQGMAINQSKAM
jgi:hypothetical protein